MTRFLFLLSFFCLSTLSAKPHILVSIAPQKFFVEQVTGDTADVQVLVPAGASPHCFEPTPKQMILASTSDIWFRIGETFEVKAIEVLKSHHPSMMIVDTRKNVPLISMTEDAKCKHCCSHGDDKDTHIWLSPRLAKIQVATIKEALTEKYPENAALFENNYAIFIEKLDLIDQELAALFKEAKERAILVSHPAFGYLCLDYNMQQLSIEVEGKDPSAKQLTNLLNKVRSLCLTRVFTQEQYQNKGAHLIAKEIKAEIYTVDPYSGDFLNNLRRMGLLFSGHHECH